MQRRERRAQRRHASRPTDAGARKRPRASKTCSSHGISAGNAERRGLPGGDLFGERHDLGVNLRAEPRDVRGIVVGAPHAPVRELGVRRANRACPPSPRGGERAGRRARPAASRCRRRSSTSLRRRRGEPHGRRPRRTAPWRRAAATRRETSTRAPPSSAVYSLTSAASAMKSSLSAASKLARSFSQRWNRYAPERAFQRRPVRARQQPLFDLGVALLGEHVELVERIGVRARLRVARVLAEAQLDERFPARERPALAFPRGEERVRVVVGRDAVELRAQRVVRAPQRLGVRRRGSDRVENAGRLQSRGRMRSCAAFDRRLERLPVAAAVRRCARVEAASR